MADAISLVANKALASWLNLGRGLVAEGAAALARASLYGEQFVQNLHGERVPALVDEGSYFTAHNVPGTPILDKAASSAFLATTPTLVLFNSNPVGGKSIYPTRFQLQVSAAGTSGTNWLSQWLVDTGNRYTSGGTALTVANPNQNVLNAATAAVVNFGSLTAPAANASRIIAAHEMRTVLKVVGDQYTFEFGSSSGAGSVGMPLDGTLQLSRTVQLPPVVIHPQESLLWYEYGASQATAASFDYINLEWVER